MPVAFSRRIAIGGEGLRSLRKIAEIYAGVTLISLANWLAFISEAPFNIEFTTYCFSVKN